MGKAYILLFRSKEHATSFKKENNLPDPCQITLLKYSLISAMPFHLRRPHQDLKWNLGTSISVDRASRQEA